MFHSFIGRIISNTFNRLASVQLLVKSCQHDSENTSGYNSHGSHETVVNPSTSVLMIFIFRVQICGIDGSRIGNGVDESQSRRSLGWRTRKRIADPSQGRCITTIQAGNLLY